VSRDRTLYPQSDRRVPESDALATANGTALQDEDGKGDPVPEIKKLLCLGARHVVNAPPVFEEATNRRPTLEHLEPHRRRVPDCIRGKEARHRFNITAVCSIHSAAHQLHQVGRRGLLGHRPLKYAAAEQRPLLKR